MISLYTGTPGSGKSLDVARLILIKLKMGINVIGTMYLDQSKLTKYKGKYIFCDIYKLNPQDLISYARKYHVKGKEGQCWLVIDECQRIFNARDWGNKDRREWNDFFQVHRHFGYNVALITQYDRLIDRQLRALVEYQYIHRKISNFGFKGWLISFFCGGGLFISVSEWYPLHEKIDSTFFRYRKKYATLYDSYMAFSEDSGNDVNELAFYLKEDTAVDESGDEGDPRTASAVSDATFPCLQGLPCD